VASVASILIVKNGICSDARIVLGAVAPAPLRATAAEMAMKGKPIDEALATMAAELALDGAKPFEGNEYKAKIARTLVKRSILGLSC